MVENAQNIRLEHLEKSHASMDAKLDELVAFMYEMRAEKKLMRWLLGLGIPAAIAIGIAVGNHIS